MMKRIDIVDRSDSWNIYFHFVQSHLNCSILSLEDRFPESSGKCLDTAPYQFATVI